MPIRIQLSRRKGWRMPADTVRVSRPGKWGNPFRVEEHGRAEAMTRYRSWLEERIEAGELDPKELRGKNLACWCRLDQECHADTLLRKANARR